MWNIKESRKKVFVSSLLRNIRHACNVNVQMDCKINRVCLWGLILFGLGYLCVVVFYASVMNTVS